MPARPYLCLECGAAIEPHREACFCGRRCRMVWHNRRQARGTEVYDLLMALRYERGLAKRLGLWSRLCRLAQRWREDDVRARAGRRSWSRPQEAIARTAWAAAEILTERRRA